MLALTLNATPQTTSTVDFINTFLSWDIFSDVIIWVVGLLFAVLIITYVLSHIRK